MKVETLNLNGGKLFEPLMSHVSNSAGEIDIFCFQEAFDNNSGITESNGARANLYKELCHALPGFTGIYCPAESGLDYNGVVDFDLSFGVAAFIKDNLEIFKERCAAVYDGGAYDYHPHFGRKPRKLQSFQIRDIQGIETFIANLHGVWIPGNKEDSPSRLDQARRVRSVMNEVSGRRMLVGDFNVDHTTESFKILGDGMRNLVGDFGILTTRSRLYGKPNKFADYILTSPEIDVKDFKSLDVEVSDHLPLVVKCD